MIFLNNYIILNGIDSRSINGLLISTLPPVTKPFIRTQIDEIDGRDGDIVTKLGYSAYDKSFNIGLHGDYNIDDIIAFFDSEGKVTFSNEDDKYYNYQIVSQIDFERLRRFKTATVTMHVQPFKYSLLEGTKAITIDNVYSNVHDIIVRNNGNVVSKPTITIYGTGGIELGLNGKKILNIELGNDAHITIDVTNMNAHKDGVSKNRKVSGNYDEFILSVGKNTINITGDATKIEIDGISRWI